VLLDEIVEVIEDLALAFGERLHDGDLPEGQGRVGPVLGVRSVVRRVCK